MPDRACGIHLKNAPRVQAKVHHLSPVEKCTTSNELPVARRCRKELGGGYLGSVATGQASGSAWVVGAPDRAGAGAEPANGDPRLAGGSAPAVSPGVDDFPAGFLAGQAGSGAPPGLVRLASTGGDPAGRLHGLSGGVLQRLG